MAVTSSAGEIHGLQVYFWHLDIISFVGLLSTFIFSLFSILSFNFFILVTLSAVFKFPLFFINLFLFLFLFTNLLIRLFTFLDVFVFR